MQLSHVIKILGCILSNNKKDILVIFTFEFNSHSHRKDFVQTPGVLKQVYEVIQKPSEPIKKLGLWLLEKIVISESLDKIFAVPEILTTLSQISQNGSWKVN